MAMTSDPLCFFLQLLHLQTLDVVHAALPSGTRSVGYACTTCSSPLENNCSGGSISLCLAPLLTVRN